MTVHTWRHSPEKYAYNISMLPDYSMLAVKYVEKSSEVKEIVKARGGKSIIFVSCKETGEKLCKEICSESQLKAAFLSSDNKEDEGKKIVDELLRKQKFSADVLVTTSVNDVGTNIKDPEVKTIIIRAYEAEEFVQMLGRIRVPKDKGYEGITLYIWDVEVNDIQRRLDETRRKLQVIERYEREKLSPTQFFLQLDEEEKNLAQFLYLSNSRKLEKVSSLCIYRLRELFYYYQNILKEQKIDRTSFIKSHLAALGKEDDFSNENYASKDIREKNRKDVLEQMNILAEKCVDREMEKDELKALFLDKVKPLVRMIDGKYVRSNVSLSVNRFNEICKMEKFPFCIKKMNGRIQKYMIEKEENNE